MAAEPEPLASCSPTSSSSSAEDPQSRHSTGLGGPCMGAGLCRPGSAHGSPCALLGAPLIRRREAH